MNREGHGDRKAAGNKALPTVVSFLCTGLLTMSCVRFEPKPISATLSLDDFEARRLEAPELKDFLRTRQGLTDWPPHSWDLHSLTLAAFYYHPDLDVARAQWGVARAGMITAGQRPNPSLTASQGYDSTTPVEVITPWIPEIVLGIPIQTAGKRGIRISQTRHLSEAARLNILTVAWSVRSRLRRAFLDLYTSQQTELLLAKQRDIQTEIVRLLEIQLAAGEVSPYQVTQARIALDNLQLAVLEAARQRLQARARLADAVGLPAKALDDVTFSFDGLQKVRPAPSSKEIRRRALVNRSDILRSLAEYQASQSALQLEIAKQYPDLNIGLGYQLDQTDSKWTLGLGLVLPIAHRNKGPIAEAEARRKEAAARFLSLQAKVIGEIDRAMASSRSAAEGYKSADVLLADLTRRDKSAGSTYRLGEISKLDLLGVRLELVSSALVRLDALAKAQQAFGELEDAMQSPLDVNEWILETPARRPGQGVPKDE